MSNQRENSPINGSVLVVDDDKFIVELIKNELTNHGIETLTASHGAEAIKTVNEEVAVIVLDLLMPRMGGKECLSYFRREFPHVPVIVLSAKNSASDATDVLRSGAYHYLTKPFSTDELISTIQEATLYQQNTEQGAERLPLQIRSPNSKFATDASYSAMLSKIAASEASVLITGESGTGKSAVARRIHEMSPRSNGPFISINCSSLPRELFESELFGYEKGAFTGADKNRKGKVDAADGGTLFLDEIGDLPLEMQPKLLTFLQEKSYHPIGSNKLKHADTRIMAATHQDLELRCESEEFRQDLYYRISVLELDVPTLRSKSPENFKEIVDSCIQHLQDRYMNSDLELDPEVYDRLYGHPWPGNVRELENCLERAVVFCESNRISVGDIHLKEVRGNDENDFQRSLLAFLKQHSLRELEELCYTLALDSTQGNRNEAAKILGVSERTVFNKLKKNGTESES